MTRSNLQHCLVVLAASCATAASAQSSDDLGLRSADLDELEMYLTDDSDGGVRLAAIKELARRGEKARPLASQLTLAVGDEIPSVRNLAVELLDALGVAIPSALSRIVEIGDRRERAQAARGLGHLRERAASEIPVLLRRFEEEEDRNAKAVVVWALGEIGGLPAHSGLERALEDQDARVRLLAARGLSKLGSQGLSTLKTQLVKGVVRVRLAIVTEFGEPPYSQEQAFLLRFALDDADPETHCVAAESLGRMGVLASPFLPSLVRARDSNSSANGAVLAIAKDAEIRGVSLYWVVPRVYWKQLTGFLALLLTWFGLFGRFPRHRHSTTPKHLALMALTAAVPVALSCSAVYYAITREWAQGFLPDAITVVPFPVAAVLSVAFVCALPAVWVCQRKTLAAKVVDDPQE